MSKTSSKIQIFCLDFNYYSSLKWPKIQLFLFLLFHDSLNNPLKSFRQSTAFNSRACHNIPFSVIKIVHVELLYNLIRLERGSKVLLVGEDKYRDIGKGIVLYIRNAPDIDFGFLPLAVLSTQNWTLLASFRLQNRLRRLER